MVHFWIISKIRIGAVRVSSVFLGKIKKASLHAAITDASLSDPLHHDLAKPRPKILPSVYQWASKNSSILNLRAKRTCFAIGPTDIVVNNRYWIIELINFTPPGRLFVHYRVARRRYLNTVRYKKGKFEWIHPCLGYYYRRNEFCFYCCARFSTWLFNKCFYSTLNYFFINNSRVLPNQFYRLSF